MFIRQPLSPLLPRRNFNVGGAYSLLVENGDQTFCDFQHTNKELLSREFRFELQLK